VGAPDARADGAAPTGVRPEKGTYPDTYWVLVVLAEEVAAADPSVPLPDQARIEAVGFGGDLGTPEARALLKDLEVASTKAHVPFPRSLATAPPPKP
jgi:hypothetical protein